MAVLCLGVPATMAGGQSATPSASRATRQERLDAVQMLRHVQVLSADSLEGRRVGTRGSEKARAYLLPFFQRYGLQPLNGRYEEPFRFAGRSGADSVQGVNLAGVLRGTRDPDHYIVISGHYDHLGIRPSAGGDSIYNGADDNASGAAAVIALAEYFSRNRPLHSILFVNFDAEESGLRGARAFVNSPPVPIAQIAIDVNMDMMSRSVKGELYAVGTAAFPALRPYVAGAQPLSRIALRIGHEGPGVSRSDDWTDQSDQGEFNRVGIPFLYFGVEDHPDYHRPSDEYERIQPEFYVHAVESVLDVVLALDKDLAPVIAARRH
jgi:Zn-dependent M28 family amino/carboxypeptidase